MTPKTDEYLKGFTGVNMISRVIFLNYKPSLQQGYSVMFCWLKPYH